MWIYKLSPHLRHNHATVMLFTLAEGFRRFQWMFVRTEVRLACCTLPARASAAVALAWGTHINSRSSHAMHGKTSPMQWGRC